MRNPGFAESIGKCIQFLDSDDLRQPVKLDKQAKVLTSEHLNSPDTGTEIVNEDMTFRICSNVPLPQSGDWIGVHAWRGVPLCSGEKFT